MVISVADGGSRSAWLSQGTGNADFGDTGIALNLEEEMVGVIFWVTPRALKKDTVRHQSHSFCTRG